MLKLLLLLSFLKASPQPDSMKALSNINILGPQLTMSLAKYVDMNCAPAKYKDETCLIKQVYGDYLRSTAFLQEKSQSDLADLYVPDNVTSLDYRAINWHLGPFTASSTHSQIIEHIYKTEITKHLLALLVEKFKFTLDVWNGNNPVEYRYSHIPLILAWLNGTSTFAQYYYFEKAQSCLVGQTLCIDQKQKYWAAISRVKLEFSGPINNVKTMIEDSGAQPWEEARLLKQVYDLDNHIIALKKLNLKSTLEVWKGDLKSVPEFVEYFKEVVSVTSRAKVLSNVDQVNLYREVIKLKEIDSLVTEESQANMDSNVYSFLNDSVDKTINTVGEFYKRREGEITNGI